MFYNLSACVRACVRACERACVCACACVCFKLLTLKAGIWNSIGTKIHKVFEILSVPRRGCVA